MRKSQIITLIILLILSILVYFPSLWLGNLEKNSTENAFTILENYISYLKNEDFDNEIFDKYSNRILINSDAGRKYYSFLNDRGICYIFYDKEYIVSKKDAVFCS